MDKDNPQNFGYYYQHKKYYDRYLSKTLDIEAKLSEEIRNFYKKGNGNHKTAKDSSKAVRQRRNKGILGKGEANRLKSVI